MLLSSGHVTSGGSYDGVMPSLTYGAQAQYTAEFSRFVHYHHLVFVVLLHGTKLSTYQIKDSNHRNEPSAV